MILPVLLLIVNMLEEGLSGVWERILYLSIPLAVFGSSLSWEVTVITNVPRAEQEMSVFSSLVKVCHKLYIKNLNVKTGVPGLAPSSTVPFQIWWVNSGRLSFISMTLMMMSMGFSIWFPLMSTAWARSCERKKSKVQNSKVYSHNKSLIFNKAASFDQNTVKTVESF